MQQMVGIMAVGRIFNRVFLSGVSLEEEIARPPTTRYELLEEEELLPLAQYSTRNRKFDDEQQ